MCEMKNQMTLTLSGFDGRGEMQVVAQRPSILTLARLGKIPNPLLGAAAKLFSFGGKAAEPSLKEVADTLHIVAEAALIEPAYDAVKEQLTDDQLMELYQFAKGGVDALNCFRKLGGFFAGGTGGKAQRQGGQPDAGNP